MVGTISASSGSFEGMGEVDNSPMNSCVDAGLKEASS